MTPAAMVRGANTQITAATVQARISWRPGLPVDACAVLLASDRKVRNDDDFVFYNQSEHPSGSVCMRHESDTSASVVMHLGRMPEDVDRVVIAGSVDMGTFRNVSGLEITLTGKHNHVLARFPITHVEAVTALVFGEVYRRQGAWRFRAVGQGWGTGLAGLATNFGVNVEEEKAEPDLLSPTVDSDSNPTTALPIATPQGQTAYVTGTDRFLASWRGKIQYALASTGPTGPTWDQLWADLRHRQIDEQRGREILRPFAVEYLQKMVTFAFADGIIEPHEMQAFDEAVTNLTVTSPEVDEMRRRMHRGFRLSKVSEGDLPRISHTSVPLEIEEILHLDTRAVQLRHLRTGVRRRSGRLIVTNRKLRFAAAAGGFELKWAKVSEARSDYGRLRIAVTAAQGGGIFEVQDADYAAAVVMGALKVARRLAAIPGDRDSRSIPQHVKAEVWRRDGGKCRQCGAREYLEFDHLIPWSQNGATSVNNLQLLCRRCNLAKGSRI